MLLFIFPLMSGFTQIKIKDWQVSKFFTEYHFVLSKQKYIKSMTLFFKQDRAFKQYRIFGLYFVHKIRIILHGGLGPSGHSKIVCIINRAFSLCKTNWVLKSFIVETSFILFVPVT